jgi:hypothetical protein
LPAAVPDLRPVPAAVHNRRAVPATAGAAVHPADRGRAGDAADIHHHDHDPRLPAVSAALHRRQAMPDDRRTRLLRPVPDTAEHDHDHDHDDLSAATALLCGGGRQRTDHDHDHGRHLPAVPAAVPAEHHGPLSDDVVGGRVAEYRSDLLPTERDVCAAALRAAAVPAGATVPTRLRPASAAGPTNPRHFEADRLT